MVLEEVECRRLSERIHFRKAELLSSYLAASTTEVALAMVTTEERLREVVMVVERLERRGGYT